jgi:hypothetical protein
LSIIPTISTKQKKVLAVIVNNTTNINKTKESFSRDCQYLQSRLKFFFVLLILLVLLTITAKTFFCFVDIGGIIDNHG